jgi:hypothetical protein
MKKEPYYEIYLYLVLLPPSLLKLLSVIGLVEFLLCGKLMHLLIKSVYVIIYTYLFYELIIIWKVREKKVDADVDFRGSL